MTKHDPINQIVQAYDDAHASDAWKTETGIDLGMPENGNAALAIREAMRVLGD